MTLRSENRRLIPCRGLIRLNFGFSASPETNSLVWKKVAATATTAVVASSGPAANRKVFSISSTRPLRLSCNPVCAAPATSPIAYCKKR